MFQKGSLKAICPLLVGALTSLLVLSSQATPPTIGVEQASGLDDGSRAMIVGIAVEIFVSDSGYTKILLADSESGSTLEVWSEGSPSHALPGSPAHVNVGDLVLVEGRVSTGRTTPVVFTTNAEVTVLAQARIVLTVDFLCENWRLFEGDRFNISGLVVSAPESTGERLSDASGRHSIRIEMMEACERPEVGTAPILDCVLTVDFETMSLVLNVWDIAAQDA